MMLEVNLLCNTHHMDDVRGPLGDTYPIIWMMLEVGLRVTTHHMDDVRGS